VKSTLRIAAFSLTVLTLSTFGGRALAQHPVTSTSTTVAEDPGDPLPPFPPPDGGFAVHF